ncbi:P-loop containing nucleoside triphosphate hydrolase protein [Hygrophoropsis aurantiaca]|uniref:P-loop containing nucleoside triphosphate hydrolase protein n=1 Tax=Hygrophoropsis aurantiaca TaxID=72124 RepID=A0ACB8A0P7_9AGAM|nr:P-loop containing nucleoside triphosphate hydrolase protein [Hygrophoropsis aurantiaca]
MTDVLSASKIYCEPSGQCSVSSSVSNDNIRSPLRAPSSLLVKLMMSSDDVQPTAVKPMVNHILQQLQAHRSRFSPNSRIRPLFVGVQGPQGSGKTFLTSRLRSHLTSAPHTLSVAVLSIDDLYLPHAGLKTLAEQNPHNRLLHGRGQPGTHDVSLGRHILEQLRLINDTSNQSTPLELPSFDKSLFDGEGDRIPFGMVVKAPVDVVVLEGWCVGFHPVSEAVIEQRWMEPVKGLEEIFDLKTFVRKEDILAVNEHLQGYMDWWRLLDAFIQIRGPTESPYSVIYKWRLQQEHHMKMKNGGKGMKDEQVKTFVDRYIPGYVFFGDGVRDGSLAIGPNGEIQTVEQPPWLHRGLGITIGEDRELLDVGGF